MLNTKLLEEVLKTLYADNSGNQVSLNSILKTGGYTVTDIIATMRYMNDLGMIGASQYNMLRRKDPVTEKVYTLDEIEIATKILPAGMTYYRENFAPTTSQVINNFNAPNGNITQTNVGAAANSPVNVFTEISREKETNSWEKYSWIIAVLVGIGVIVGYFSDFFTWLNRVLNS